MNKYEFHEMIVDTIRSFFKTSGAVEMFCPVLTNGTGACENVPTAFITESNGEPVFLSQTTQPELEIAVLRDGMTKVFTVGRSYRNEPKVGDGRHLSEFLLIEYEDLGMNLAALIEFEKDLIHYVIETVLDQGDDAINAKQQDVLVKIRDTEWPVVTYTELVSRLQSQGVSMQWGDDLSSRDEEMICMMYGGTPTFVTHWPEAVKFFNMRRTDRAPLEPGMSISEYNSKRLTVECCDLLLPHAGETIGSSERETNVETLRLKLVESTMFHQMVSMLGKWLYEHRLDDGTIRFDPRSRTLAAFEPYLSAFVGHDEQKIVRSGFGLGMGRMLQFLTGSTKVVEI